MNHRDRFINPKECHLGTVLMTLSYLCCSNKESFAACPDFLMKKHGEKFGYVEEIL